MTVSELIEELRKWPLDTEVMVIRQGDWSFDIEVVDSGANWTDGEQRIVIQYADEVKA